MAKTQDIKRRIRSISNTKQLTNAMKMVSAAKLRKTQERMMQARPYAERTLNILRSLALRANPEIHPLLQTHGDQKIEVILVTADKGLCGPFNSALIRECEPVLDPNQQGGPDPDIDQSRGKLPGHPQRFVELPNRQQPRVGRQLNIRRLNHNRLAAKKTE